MKVNPKYNSINLKNISLTSSEMVHVGWVSEIQFSSHFAFIHRVQARL